MLTVMIALGAMAIALAGCVWLKDDESPRNIDPFWR